MPENRYYIKERLVPDETVYLEGPEAHHLSKVMRKKNGAQVELINGKCQLAKAEVIEEEKERVRLKLFEVQNQAPSPFSLTLYQAFLKPSLLEWVIEKGVELGVTQFCLFPAKKSEKKELSPNQQTRLQHLMISAMKQCGRLDIPNIRFLSEIQHMDSFKSPAFFGTLDKKAPLLAKLEAAKATLIIGPESGWTETEEELLIEKGAQGICLHSNTLRAETAALCALSQASYLMRIHAAK